MTLTPAQAEIVRRFVAGEDIGDIASSLEDAEDQEHGHAPSSVPWVRSYKASQSALRAALLSKDAEIERLKRELAAEDDGTGNVRESGRQHFAKWREEHKP